MSDTKTECDYVHPLYKRKIFTRRSVRDAIEGTDAVKRANEVYLPMPSGMDVDSTPTNLSRNVRPGTIGEMIPNSVAPVGGENSAYFKDNAPYYHQNDAYRAYLQRARFPELTVHTLKGLVGTATRLPMDVELPTKLKYLEDNATNDGLNLKELYAFLLSEVLQAGNVALVVDIDTKTNKPYLCVYEAETSINWREESKTKRTLLSVFMTNEVVIPESEEEKFVTGEVVDRCLVYDVDSKGIVYQTEYLDGEETNKVTPSLLGVSFNDVPVVYIGAVENSPTPQAPPLLGISEIAYSIYRKDADLSQSQYMTCNPNLVISGMDTENQVPALVGSTAALLLPNPNAKAYYTETDTSALDHVSTAIQDLFQEAMMYGASLSGPTKKGVESTDTVQMRGNNQGASLINIVKNVAAGIEEAFEICAHLLNEKGEIALLPSLEFAEKSLSPQMLTALTSAWMGSGLSKETLLRNFKEAGILKEDEDIQEEMDRIESEGPASGDDLLDESSPLNRTSKNPKEDKKDKKVKKVNKGKERKEVRKQKKKEEELVSEASQVE